MYKCTVIYQIVCVKNKSSWKWTHEERIQATKNLFILFPGKKKLVLGDPLLLLKLHYEMKRSSLYQIYHFIMYQVLLCIFYGHSNLEEYIFVHNIKLYSWYICEQRNRERTHARALNLLFYKFSKSLIFAH